MYLFHIGNLYIILCRIVNAKFAQNIFCVAKKKNHFRGLLFLIMTAVEFEEYTIILDGGNNHN